MAKIFFYQDSEIVLNKDDWKHLEEGKGVEIFADLKKEIMLEYWEGQKVLKWDGIIVG